MLYCFVRTMLRNLLGTDPGQIDVPYCCGGMKTATEAKLSRELKGSQNGPPTMGGGRDDRF